VAGFLRIEWNRRLEGELEEIAVSGPLPQAGAIVLAAMKETIPVSSDGSYGRPAGYARSRLRLLNSGIDPAGAFIDVGTDATTPDGTCYPAIVHYGAKPHVIESHGNYPLRDKHGRVFGRRVMHPGSRPTYWATRATAALAGRRL
jgi:hypothetical protein